MHDPNVVADIFQLTQIVRGNKHRCLMLGNIRHDDTPDLSAHDRIESVYRLIQDQDLRSAADRKPERHLLLHTFGESSDAPLGIDVREEFPHLLKQFFVKFRINSLIKPLHLHGVRLHEIKQFIRYVRKFFFYRRIFKNRHSIDQNRSRILLVYACDMADDR